MRHFKRKKLASSVFSDHKSRDPINKTTHKKILFIEQSIPRIDQNAGAITIDQFMELFLRAGWEVTLWPQDRCFSTHYGQLLEQRGVKILSSDHSLRGFKSWWRTTAEEYSTVLVSRPAVCAAFLPILRKYGNAKIIYYGHDLHFARLQSEADLTDFPELFWLSMRFKQMESWIWKNTDYSYYPSAKEANAARSIAPQANIRNVIPYFFEKVSHFNHGPPQNHKILFVGNFSHPPNIDAVGWLVQEILPSIRNQCSTVELLIVGSGLSRKLKKRFTQEPGVNMVGWLSDKALSITYESCRVVVVPLRFGAGVKHKVVAALAMGRPVVMTNIGAQGMEWLDGSVDVVENTTAFASATVRLLTDDAYWRLRTAFGLEGIQNHFTTSAMASAFDELASLKVKQH